MLKEKNQERVRKKGLGFSKEFSLGGKKANLVGGLEVGREGIHVEGGLGATRVSRAGQSIGRRCEAKRGEKWEVGFGGELRRGGRNRDCRDRGCRESRDCA